MATAASTPDSTAADQVFDTPELLEQILLFAVEEMARRQGDRCQSDPCPLPGKLCYKVFSYNGPGGVTYFTDTSLLILQRVSKTWQNTISGSMALKQTIGWVPLPTDERREEETWGEFRPLYQLWRTMNEVVPQCLYGGYNSNKLKESRQPAAADKQEITLCFWPFPEEEPITFEWGRWHMRLRMKEIFARPEASWRQIKISDSVAPNELTLRIVGNADGWSNYWEERGLCEPKATWRLGKDATLGEVYDRLMGLYKMADEIYAEKMAVDETLRREYESRYRTLDC